MTAELARSRGLGVSYSEYSFVSVIEVGRCTVRIDNDYEYILRERDDLHGSRKWRQDIPGNELADILEAGLVELEGE